MHYSTYEQYNLCTCLKANQINNYSFN